MAAYAAAVSVLDTLSSLLRTNHQFSNTPNYPKSQIEILGNGVFLLTNFLENNPEIKSDFETRIRDAIYEAEDFIDSHIFEAEINQSFCGDLERVIHKINSIVEMTKEEFNHLTLDRKIRSLSWRKEFNCVIKEYPWVGRHEDLIQLKNRLMTGSKELQVIPIVGIRGMGKTALARHIFKDPSIYNGHFDNVCWVKVPVEYHKRDVLLGLLESMKKRADGFRHMTDDQLAKHVSNALKNKKYLIIADNIRDIAAWNDLKEVLPDYNNGSRILLTTRNMDAVWNAPHQLDRLSDDDTFALLGQLVFVDEPCPPELLVFAKDIIQSCRGLPLAIYIVGRLIGCAELNAENWEIILSAIKTSKNYVDLTEALESLSYKHLPQKLKSFLLYFAMFPYEYEISTFKVINLLLSERFFQRSIALEPLENQVMNFLVELFQRRLVVGFKNGFRFRLTIDEEVLHEFIARKAKEENFFHVINEDTNNGFPQENSTYNQQRRLCIRKNIHHFIKDMSEYKSNPSVSIVRSLLHMGPEHQCPLRSWLEFKLLKVLHILHIRFYTFPPEILKLLQLRYLALSCNGKLPAAVCKLQNLQILIVLHYLRLKHMETPSYLPMEIWNMKELRYLKVTGSDLPNPPSDNNLLLENLLTLSDVCAHNFTPHIFERLKKLAQLKIRIESPLEDESSVMSFFSHLVILDELYLFKCVVMYPNIGCHKVVPSFIPIFPHSLIKLILSGCGFPWEYMRSIAVLPNLEILKLKSYAFRGLEWEVKKDDFPKLEVLLLEDMDLAKWILADGSFPHLTALDIRHCYKLHEIPLEFANITTLGMIEVEDCSPSVTDSAQQINKVRKDSKNDQIQVDLYSSLDD